MSASSPDLGAETPPPPPTENTPYLYQADPGAEDTHVLGVVGATPNTDVPGPVPDRRRCNDDGQLVDPSIVAQDDERFLTTADRRVRARSTSPSPFVPSGETGTTYIAAQIVPPPAGEQPRAVHRGHGSRTTPGRTRSTVAANAHDHGLPRRLRAVALVQVPGPARRQGQGHAVRRGRRHAQTDFDVFLFTDIHAGPRRRSTADEPRPS